MAEPVILVTGASGYIATHIVQQLQQQGHRVRATVRSMQNDLKIKPLRELCPDAKYPLELVEAELLDAPSWERAVKGCQYVIHVASPFPLANPETVDELVKPAVQGTLNVLRACCKEKVRRVVLTSSVVAVFGGFIVAEDGRTYSETDWSPDRDEIGAYALSKTRAEKAAWDYVASLPEHERFELAAINPGFVIGPVLCGMPGSSAGMIAVLLKRNIPRIPKLCTPWVDVRDVAAAHIKAMTSPEAAGHRHILVESSVWVSELTDIIEEEFKDKGHFKPTDLCPDFEPEVRGLFSAEPFWGKYFKFDNSRLRTVLGIEPIGLKKQVIDTCYNLIERGFVVKAD